MVYEEYYIMTESTGWNVETQLPWDRLNKKAAAKEYATLAKLRDACIIESYHPIGTGRLMALLADDIDATGIFSVELYEGFRHFYALKRYLESVSYEPPVTDDDIAAIRRTVIDKPYTGNLTRELVNFLFSEHFAAYFFLRISQSTKEPVLQSLSTFIARDEFRHAQAAADILMQQLIKKRVRKEAVIETAYAFRHYGHDVVADVPVFEKNDIQAIGSFMKKVERLTGIRMVEYVKSHKL